MNQWQSLLSSAALRRMSGTDLEYDREKLEELVQVALEAQEQVVRRYLSLRQTWEEALASGARAASADSVDAVSGAPKPGRPLERRRTIDLRPNRFNGAFFPDSLGESSIATIADDLARYGQRVPVEVTPDGELVDGERRWRGARRLGWSSIEVVVGPALSDEEMLDRVVDCCTSARQMTVREQVNVYAAVRARLQRDAGRLQGRPSKTFQEGNVFSAQHLRAAAATRAGFSSAAIALRAEAVFTRGSAEVQQSVSDGALSISAAYEQLPKRARGLQAEPDPPTEPDLADVASHEVAKAPSPVASHAAHESAADQPVAASDLAPVAPTQEMAAALSGIRVGERLPGTVAPEQEERPDARVDGHVAAVCEHLRHLAGRNASAAVAFFDRVVGEFKTALGDVGDNEQRHDFEGRSTP